METRVQGNSCLNCLYKFLNIFLVPVGLGVMIAGIYVCATDGSFTWYDGSFIGMGFLTILASLLGHKSKYSLVGMTFTCVLECVLSAAMIGFTISILTTSDLTNRLGSSNAKAVEYSLLCASIIIVCTFFLAVFYRNSLKLARFKNENDPRKNYTKMSDATPRTDKRREEMKAKYNL